MRSLDKDIETNFKFLNNYIFCLFFDTNDSISEMLPETYHLYTQMPSFHWLSSSRVLSLLNKGAVNENVKMKQGEL